MEHLWKAWAQGEQWAFLLSESASLQPQLHIMPSCAACYGTLWEQMPRTSLPLIGTAIIPTTSVFTPAFHQQLNCAWGVV